MNCEYAAQKLPFQIFDEIFNFKTDSYILKRTDLSMLTHAFYAMASKVVFLRYFKGGIPQISFLSKSKFSDLCQRNAHLCEHLFLIWYLLSLSLPQRVLKVQVHTHTHEI